MANSTVATVRIVDCVDIYGMSEQELYDMCSPEAQQARADSDFRQIRDLLDRLSLNVEQLKAVKSLVDELLYGPLIR